MGNLDSLNTELSELRNLARQLETSNSEQIGTATKEALEKVAGLLEKVGAEIEESNG